MSFLRKQESRLVPAKAGNQKYKRLLSRYLWIPAKAGAGMTKRSVDDRLIICLLYYFANSLGNEPIFFNKLLTNF